MIPLSTKMRPNSIDDFVGQDHFLYKGSLLYNSIKNRTFDSAIFFGPPGSGKTTLARIIAKEMDSEFVEINASSTGTKELKLLIENAKLKFYGLQKSTTYVYIDEFHRWNKLQQDSLLKALEEGVIHFIGSTTENPYFAVNNAIISRVRSIYEFKPLKRVDLIKLINNAVRVMDDGREKITAAWNHKTKELLADMASGDARIALDSFGFIIENIEEGIEVDESIIEEAMQSRINFYDKREDKYNLLSALQKSVRGSDPDAAIHYLARLLEGGGDIQMIARRLLVMASEDVGMAYPNAISIVTGCVQAALMVGLPEARINLAQAVVTLAASPKSNTSYMALSKAIEDLRKKDTGDVPSHLKDAHYSGAKDRGLGIGYMNPHDFGGYVNQQYIPDKFKNTRYYEPGENGNEKSFKKYLEELEALKKNRKVKNKNGKENY